MLLIEHAGRVLWKKTGPPYISTYSHLKLFIICHIVPNKNRIILG